MVFILLPLFLATPPPSLPTPHYHHQRSGYVLLFSDFEEEKV
jgi:hypothetical protein